MSNNIISKIALPNGDEYSLKPGILQSKTYTNVYCTENKDPAGFLYFGHLIPTDANAQVYIKFQVTGTMAGVNNNAGAQSSVVEYSMYQSTMLWYQVHNSINNTSYRNWYNHCVYRATIDGITAEYGHLLGLRFQSAYYPASSSYARTITINILELQNATFTFEDSMILYANAPGTGSTNYAGRNEYNGTAQGDIHTGDANDVNYQNREYYVARTTNSALYRYMFCATKIDGSIVPMNSVNNSVATNKTLTTDSFDPFGDFFFWNSTSTYNANANVGDGYWYRQILFDLRYSFNCGGYDTASTLTARLPLYLVTTLQNDGNVVLYSSPLTQALPNTEDGLLYIYLGRIYPDAYPYRCILSFKHPIYYYKDGEIRQYFSTDIPTGLITDANGTARKVYLTTTEAVPSGAVTGDIVFVKVT